MQDTVLALLDEFKTTKAAVGLDIVNGDAMVLFQIIEIFKTK